MTWITRWTGLPKKTEGEITTRKQACSFCGHPSGHLISKGQFWDLSSFNFIRCSQCDLVQMDPMLNDTVMTEGCHAYYLMESRREGPKNLNKNRVRSFRRGIYFGLRLKKLRIQPTSVLEMGPGDGFFSRGVAYVFPHAKITCLDIVPEVIEQIQNVHGFEGRVGSLEALDSVKEKGRYDLIIARDIIEHMSTPDRVIQTLHSLLKTGGHFHYITPNGFEDIWAAYCCWKLTQRPCEVLLNHVNYFPPMTLAKKLEENHFRAVEHFIYDFNGFRWGQARKIKRDLMLPPTQNKSAKDTIDKNLKMSTNTHGLKSPLEKWWAKSRLIAYLYCLWKEHFRLRLAAEHGIGHEIHGLFRKM